MTFYDDKAAAITALTEAVEAIEMELGILPAGAYATVRTRLDILEARINNPFAPAPNALNPFFIGNTGVSIQTSFGDPNFLNVLATPGSLFLREDGYNDQGLYAFRPDGYWHQIDTDPWTANGDLAGTIYSQTVIGIQGRPVNPAAPQTDSEGDGYVLTWNQVANWWEPQIGFFAAGDLSGNKINQTVIRIQGNSVSPVAPQDGYALVWDAGTTQWEAQRLAVVFSVLDSSTDTNIVSNRFTTQSPIDSTKIGSINLSSDSTQSTSGLSGNYSAILSGDRNQVISDYSIILGGSGSLINSAQYALIASGLSNSVGGFQTVVVGGQNNAISSSTLMASTASTILNGHSNSIADSQYSVVLSGLSHFITGSQSLIGTGQSNTVSGINSVVINGISNSASGNNGVILNGLNNSVENIYNTVLNGIGNTLDSNAFHSVVAGTGNLISDGYDFVVGLNNTIANGTNKYVTIGGDFNTATAGSHYSGIWGCNNITADGYVAVFGDHNTLNSGSTYADIHGRVNVTASPYVSIWGDQNTIGTGANYSSIFGTTNIIGQGASESYVWGTNNTVSLNSANSWVVGNSNIVATSSAYVYAWGTGNQVSGNYPSAWGNTNVVSQLAAGYSSAWGSNNNVAGDYSSAWGSYNGVTGYWNNVWGQYNSVINNPDYATVFGYYGQARVTSQFVHSGNTPNGTAGAEQWSRIILDGNGASGGSFNLGVAGTGNPLTFENGKAYDITIRVLVTLATGSAPTGSNPFVASFVYDVLAHAEGGTLVLDNVNNTLNTANGTGWSIGISATSNTLVLNVPSYTGAPNGSASRRAVATVEWRELSRL